MDFGRVSSYFGLGENIDNSQKSKPKTFDLGQKTTQLSVTHTERERERVREEERIKAIVVRGGVNVLSTIR